MSRKRKDHPWVQLGGKPGEVAHCARCGQGLAMELPQSIEVVTAAMTAFDKVHALCPDTGRVAQRPTTPLEWAMGRDTGTSSLTIWSVITGRPSPHGRYDVPHDPDDFGRCYRLLQLFPGWLELLPKVAEKYPEWKPLVDNWPQLTEMYEDALATDARLDWRAMYDFMKGVRA